MKKSVAVTMLLLGVLGLFVTFPMWLMNIISDRAMIGITLALSWAALIFEGVNAIGIHEQDTE